MAKKYKKILDVLSSVDKYAGGAVLGMPFSEGYLNTKNLIKNPKKEIARRQAIQNSKSLAEQDDEMMRMVMGASLGGGSRFDKYLKNSKVDSQLNILKRAKAQESHANSPKVLPKKGNAYELELKKMVEDSGGVYKGIMKDEDGGAIVNFSDASLATDRPMALDVNNLNVDIIKKKISEKGREHLAEIMAKYKNSKKFK